MLALEQAEAHGWPIAEDHIAEFGAIVNLREQLRTSTLSHSALVSMIGDSWSIPMQGSFFMFLLAIIELESELCQVPSQISTLGKESDPESPKKKLPSLVFTPPSSAKKRRMVRNLNSPDRVVLPVFDDGPQWHEVDVSDDSQPSEVTIS